METSDQAAKEEVEGKEAVQVSPVVVVATNDQASKDRSVRLRVMPEQSNDYRVVVFGAGGVGKSSLCPPLCQGYISRELHSNH